MLTPDLSNRQKYMKMCLDTIHYLLDFSGITEKIDVVPRLIETSYDGYYFPEMVLTSKDYKHLLLFQYPNAYIDNDELTLSVMVPELRGVVKFLYNISLEINIPTPEELKAKFKEIHRQNWEKK